MDGTKVMNGSISNSWDCLMAPGHEMGISFLTLLLQILIIQLFVRILHRFVFAHLHLTPAVTQMFVGVFLAQTSPWANNGVHSTFNVVIFPTRTRNVYETVALLSYMVYSFTVAVKMDYTIVLKTGRKAIVIGVLDVIMPVVVNLCFLTHLYPDFFQRLRDKDRVVRDLFLNLTILPLSHSPNIVAFLLDMKMINSEIGRLALSSSLIGHIISIPLLLTTVDFIRPDRDLIEMATPYVIALLTGLFARPTMKWMIKQTPKGRPLNQEFLFSVTVLMLVGVWAAYQFGRISIFGAFIVGSFVPSGPPLGSTIVHKLDFLATGFLPFFLSTTIMNGDYMHIGSSTQTTIYHICLASLAYSSKFLNCLVCGLYNQMDFRDALSLSFIMSYKGLIDVGTLLMFREAQMLSRPNYTVMVLWTIVIATITPISVNYLYHPLKKYGSYQKRDIIHCKFNSELRVLVSLMRSDRVNSITRLLNACCPSEKNLISVYVLHLVSMVGRAYPIFIAHDMQKKKASRNSFSEDVIRSFYRFQHKCKGFLSVSIFTSVSPLSTMHEDTCTLALNKLVSIIVLPFHKRFMIGGSIGFEDDEQKTLNYDLLHRSPCSVGILVDRGNLDVEPISPLMVAVIYIGGLDDLETLALAKRIARDSRVRVNVIRLVATGELCDLDPSDFIALVDIQSNVHFSQQFSYTEKAVKDGAATANFLRSMVESYNLIMVGRHYKLVCTQLTGLHDMSEDTKLGVLGDLLASQDLQSKTSVLVVQQQQRQWRSELL